MCIQKFPFKIFIPYDQQAMGGMYTFLFYFKEYLKKQNIPFTHNFISKYDILFVNSWSSNFPYYKIRLAKLFNSGLCIVHRIDGSALDYGRTGKWDTYQKRINKLVNLTIFQSNYGKYATREKFKIIENDGPVIYNPVDTKLFKPSQEYRLPERAKIAYVSFSTNVRKGAEQVLRIAKQNQDIDFVLMGRFDFHTDLKNVEYTGYLSREQVARKLAQCQMFIFFSENETCPNVVLEAMASGLPILYLDSGGTAELVGDTGIAITTETFGEAFEKIWRNWRDWSKATRARAESTFSINKIVPQYLKAISDFKGQE